MYNVRFRKQDAWNVGSPTFRQTLQLLYSIPVSLNDWLTVKLLPALASTVNLGSESRGTHDHISLCDGSGSLQNIQHGNPHSPLRGYIYLSVGGEGEANVWLNKRYTGTNYGSRECNDMLCYVMLCCPTESNTWLWKRDEWNILGDWVTMKRDDEKRFLRLRVQESRWWKML
jgi:hypothetical protein